MCLIFCFLYFLFVSVINGSPDCSEYEFPCEDGGCIDSEVWCDSHKDCGDASDEKYCKMSSFFEEDLNNCPSSYFKCGSGPCIPMIGRCDGYDNCKDSSDEKNCEDLVKSDGPSTTSKPVSPLRTRTTAETTSSSTTSITTKRSQLNSYMADAEQHSLQIVYSELRPSDYFHQREMARTWLLSQRKSDFGWGDETPRALTALYLSDVQISNRRNESDLLMVKQLEVQLSMDMARNGTKAMKLTDLALYINALMASCKDPKNFYGENLVLALRNGVNAAQREATFVNPSVYLTICINNATIYEDTRKIHDMFISRNATIGRMDIQALALLTIECIYRNTDYITTTIYDGLKKQFFLRLNGGGLSGNVYEAALLAQALQKLKVTQPRLLEFILQQQQEDGSFGGILATYLVLPVLSGRSFLEMNDHCSQRYTTDLSPIDVLKNSNRRKIYVQYALNYGNPPEIIEMIQMKVAEDTNFLDVMRLAQEVSPKYRFMLDGSRDVPVVYSIGGIPNDAEKGMFWTLYLASNRNRVGGDAGRLTPFSGNIKQLMPNAAEEFVFWMKAI